MASDALRTELGLDKRDVLSTRRALILFTHRVASFGGLRRSDWQSLLSKVNRLGSDKAAPVVDRANRCNGEEFRH